MFNCFDSNYILCIISSINPIPICSFLFSVYIILQICWCITIYICLTVLKKYSANIFSFYKNMTEVAWNRLSSFLLWLRHWFGTQKVLFNSFFPHISLVNYSFPFCYHSSCVFNLQALWSSDLHLLHLYIA